MRIVLLAQEHLLVDSRLKTQEFESSAMSTYTLGQRVLYSSTSQGGQVLTEITQVLPSGAVEVHCKSGYFMRPDEQELRIQPHGQGSATPLLAALPATPTPSQQLQQAAAAPTGRSGLTPDP